MPIFKTTDQILNDPWLVDEIETPPISAALPPRLEWDYSSDLKIEDIKVWEQLYYQFGNIGIYASWDPYAEFYIIVFNLFSNTKEGIEIFYGQGSGRKVEIRAKELGIDLTRNQIWVDDNNYWLHQ